MRAFVLARSDSAECDASSTSTAKLKISFMHNCFAVSYPSSAFESDFLMPLKQKEEEKLAIPLYWKSWSNGYEVQQKKLSRAVSRCTFLNCFICTIFAASVCHRALVWIAACRCTNSESRRCVGAFAGKSTVAQSIKFALEGCKRGRWRRRGGEFNGCTGRRLHKESALSVVLTCIFQARIPSLVSLRRLSSRNGMILLPRKLSFRAGIRWNWNRMGSLFLGLGRTTFIIRCNRGGKAVCREPCWNVDREKQFSSETAFRAFLRTTNIPCGI